MTQQGDIRFGGSLQAIVVPFFLVFLIRVGGNLLFAKRRVKYKITAIQKRAWFPVTPTETTPTGSHTPDATPMSDVTISASCFGVLFQPTVFKAGRFFIGA